MNGWLIVAWSITAWVIGFGVALLVCGVRYGFRWWLEPKPTHRAAQRARPVERLKGGPKHLRQALR